MLAYQWNLHALPWAMIGLALFVLAGVIFRRQRASRVAVMFCAMITLVAVWFSAFALMFLAAEVGVATIWGRIALAGVALLPAAVYDFTATALRLQGRRMMLIRVSWLAGTGFAALTLFSEWVMGGIVRHTWGFYPTAGPALPLFLVFFFSVLITHLVDTSLEYRRTTDPNRRLAMLRMMAGFVVVYVGAVDFLPIFGVPTRPVAYVPVLAFILVAWDPIRKHRFRPITAAGAATEILETMADALFVLDGVGRIRVINGSVTALLGFAESELLGKTVDNLEWVSGESTISRTLSDLSRRRPIRDQERAFRHKDGGRVDVSVSICPVRDDLVKRGAVMIARDIRDRKRADEALRSFTRRLEQSNRELEDFAYIASHDLQEPLRKIQAFGDRLESKYAPDLPEQARDYIARMRAAAGRMQVLINDLLAFSRVATKAQPFVSVDIAGIAREVGQDLEVRRIETGGRITIGELPVIEADPLQIRQLLQNLLGNALKFHRSGVAPAIEVRSEVRDGICLLVVADNGIGFEEKYADRIFTMFERLHGRGNYEGTGIGLAICRRIAERHGGTIVARSTPGEGSAFSVTLPIKQQAADSKQ